MFLLTSRAKYICGAHYYILNEPEITGAFAFSGLGPRDCMSIYAYFHYWVDLTAVMYQGYTQSKEGDCQALGLVVYQLAKILLRAIIDFIMGLLNTWVISSHIRRRKSFLLWSP